ncbi:putative testis-expressed protein 10/pre-rRNA-processing protein Ipi1 [Helianthus annuus]|nr:putative testis-expressed protein 10/pre-rRNA-processing protein Ipi1 [Helianthus annuus]
MSLKIVDVFEILQKIKPKIGKKLRPPKNTTNTELKSKAIILPEQSLASEKAGLAVSKRGFTLKELLQQTSHHNAKVRRGTISFINISLGFSNNIKTISNFIKRQAIFSVCVCICYSYIIRSVF